MRDLSLVLAHVASTPWAILPERGSTILRVLLARAVHGRGSLGDGEAIAQADQRVYAARREAASAAPSGVGVLPIYGVLEHRLHSVSDASGGGLVAAEGITSRLRSMIADPRVDVIVLDIDSPGGSVAGIQELGDEIAASPKPVVAVANSTAASAAYWLAAQASELVVTPSGSVGSIGVYLVHEDISKALAEDGITPTIVSAGRNKVEGNPFAPLTEEARETLQASVDRYYDAFTKAVAKGRGVSAKVARGERFGEGRMFGAEEAVERGMADTVGTLDETIARFQGGGRVKRRVSAMAIAAAPEISAAAASPAPVAEPIGPPLAVDPTPAPNEPETQAAPALRVIDPALEMLDSESR
jgi:signal peptide peptidase SppA